MPKRDSTLLILVGTLKRTFWNVGMKWVNTELTQPLACIGQVSLWVSNLLKCSLSLNLEQHSAAVLGCQTVHVYLIGHNLVVQTNSFQMFTCFRTNFDIKSCDENIWYTRALCPLTDFGNVLQFIAVSSPQRYFNQIISVSSHNATYLIAKIRHHVSYQCQSKFQPHPVSTLFEISFLFVDCEHKPATVSVHWVFPDRSDSLFEDGIITAMVRFGEGQHIVEYAPESLHCGESAKVNLTMFPGKVFLEAQVPKSPCIL